MSAPLRLVLAGGGHSQVEVLRQFAMRPVPDLALTLVTRDALAPYSGMLPGFIAGHYSYQECHIDVRALARMAGARIIHAEIAGVDLGAKSLLFDDRPPVAFDLLSLNVGSRPVMDEVPGASEFAWPAKPVDEFIRRWQLLIAELEARPRAHRFVVVGAGAGGVELAMAMRHRVSRMCEGATFTVISGTPDILPTHAQSVRRRVDRALTAQGIAVRRSETVVSAAAAELVCATGLRVPYDTLVWVTQASPAPWIHESGLATDALGFARVDETLRSVSHDFVYAAGDVASLERDPRPKSGVFAVREGPFLADNLRNAALGRPLTAYRPQRRHLSLISTGDRHAIASRGAWSAEGAWVWRWKDRIDRRWMDKYRYVVPGMGTGPATDMADMLCAGCGAKLGHEALQRALSKVQSGGRDDVIIGLDAPDDAAVVEPPQGQLAVHSVDFFPPLVEDAYLAGKIAAVHCLSDLYAMGATPHTALAIAALPHATPEANEEELTDWLAGAVDVLMREHTALVGGHTLQSQTRLFGLSVNGFIPRDRLLRRAAPSPGDVLILTKPLGTGAIFAADMRGLAQNDWITDALSVMTQSNAAASRILFTHGATACTDITGFGLAGHLLRVLMQTGAGAKLRLDQLPTLDGARAATALDVRSSLFPSNAACEINLGANRDSKQSPVYPLLFDPQTSGGLVAAVSANHARNCLSELHAAGYTRAAIIGDITAHTAPAQRLQLI